MCEASAKVRAKLGNDGSVDLTTTPVGQLHRCSIDTHSARQPQGTFNVVSGLDRCLDAVLPAQRLRGPIRIGTRKPSPFCARKWRAASVTPPSLRPGSPEDPGIAFWVPWRVGALLSRSASEPPVSRPSLTLLPLLCGNHLCCVCLGAFLPSLIIRPQ